MDSDEPQVPSRSGEVSTSFGLDSLWQLLATGTSADSAVDPLVGHDIGGVTLLRMIAEGGMGRVYEAQQTKPDRLVAVKVLRPGLVSRESYRRFANEAEILGRLRHPAIAHIFTAGVFTLLDAQVPYFVMEFVPDAMPITKFVEARSLSIAARLDLFIQVLDGVSHGHAHGVVHRDLKPGNILVDKDGRPKVIDFGVARETSRGDASLLTQAGQLLGTLQYMSPEQIDTKPREVDARSDVYSLGVVLYELLTDRPPYDVCNVSLVEAARIIQERSAPPPCRFRPGISPGISRVVRKCLAKNPAARYASAAEVQAAIAQAMSAEPRRRVVLFAGGVMLAGVTLVGLGLGSERGRRLLRQGPQASWWRPAAPRTEYRFTRIADANPFLVEATGVRLYREWQDPPEVYWGPESNDSEGGLVYRFPFSGVIRSARLFAKAPCWDFFSEPGGRGRGAAAIEASSDGVHWQTVCNGLEPRAWGVDCDVDGPLPSAACGGSEIWIRIRLLVEDSPNSSYSAAQFGRGRFVSDNEVFSVTATVGR